MPEIKLEKQSFVGLFAFLAFYTSRGHNLRFFDKVIFGPIWRLNRSAIAGLLSRFNRQIGAKSTSQKSQIVTVRSINNLLHFFLLPMPGEKVPDRADEGL